MGIQLKPTPSLDFQEALNLGETAPLSCKLNFYKAILTPSPSNILPLLIPLGMVTYNLALYASSPLFITVTSNL